MSARLSKVGLLALMTALSIPIAAGAQPANAPKGKNAGQTASSSGGLEKVVVTATGTNIAGIAPVGAESLSVGRDKIEQTGLTDIHQVLLTLPQVSNLASPQAPLREGGTAGYGASGGGSNNVQGTAINLRGLGAQATLELVDGHRITPTGTQAVFSEADVVPLAAIQRVEIVADGNSAIYGSDAIGGVVNFVLRKDFEGVQASVRATFVDGYEEFGASVTAGHDWDHLFGLGPGNFVVTYDFNHRTAMRSDTRPRLAQNLTPYGGIDNRITNGAVNGGVGPGQPSANATAGYDGNAVYCDNYAFGTCLSNTYVYFGLPAGNGTGLTTADLSPTPNLNDRIYARDYLGRQWHHQLAGYFDQQLTTWLTFYFEGFYTKKRTVSRQSQYDNGQHGTYYVEVDPGSPFYVAPPAPYAPNTPMFVQYDYTGHLGNFVTTNPDENFTLIGGFKIDLPFSWHSDLSYTYGRDRTCGICQFGTNLDTGAFQYEVNIGAINPLDNRPLTAAQKAAVLGNNVQWSRMGIKDFNAKFNGPLFDLPGGKVRAAVGFEYYYNSEYILNGANRTDVTGGGPNPGNAIPESSPLPPAGYEGVGCYAPYPCPPRTQPNQFAVDNIGGLNRKVTSVYGELYVPIVGDSNAMPLVKALEVDAAVRYDHYSDFGDTTNPKIGLTWYPVNDLKVRASWGTSFRAPTLTDINPFVFSVKVGTLFPNYTTDPNIDHVVCIPGLFCLSNTLFFLGAPQHLQPEKANSWSLGFDYTPNWLRGFKFSSTYYSYDYSNQITSPPFASMLANNANEKLYSTYITPIHNPATCVNGDPSTYDPKLRPFVNDIGIYGGINLPNGYCSVQVVLDGRETNAASVTLTGLDLNATYALDSDFGAWLLGVDATTTLTEDYAAVAGQAPQSRLGTINNDVRWLGRANVTWSKGAWTANLFMNYVGSYQNNVPIAGHPNSHVPAWITFDAGVSYSFDNWSWSGLKDTRLSVHAQNLFDRAPPIVLSGTNSYDPNMANIYGRIVTVQLTKKF